MNIENYFKSVTLEIEALKNRVRDFIDDSHWQTDGEWKESVLRSILSRNIPENIKIGRGFIISADGSSTQIDVLVYRNDSPVFFRDADLVFIPPEGVLAVIEVKSNITKSSLKDALLKLKHIRNHFKSVLINRAIFGLFSFDEKINSNDDVLHILRQACKLESEVVDLISLGQSKLFKYFATDPNGGRGIYNRWHSYTLKKMAPGYFIHDILLHVSPEIFWTNKTLLLPDESKEHQKDGEIFHKGSLAEKMEKLLKANPASPAAR